MKDGIKEIVADILYLDSVEEVGDKSALFTELDLSSIDYIDLCFELQKKFNIKVTQDNLWPLNKMLLDKKCYQDNEWTDDGWHEVVSLVGLDNSSSKLSIQKLYDYFTVDYIDSRLQVLS